MVGGVLGKGTNTTKFFFFFFKLLPGLDNPNFSWDDENKILLVKLANGAKQMEKHYYVIFFGLFYPTSILPPPHVCFGGYPLPEIKINTYNSLCKKRIEYEIHKF